MPLRSLLLAAVLAAPAAHAGLTLSYATTTAKGGKRTVAMYLEGKKVAFDIQGEGENARNATLVWDGDGKHFLMVNHNKKAYQDLPEEKIKAMKAGMEQQREMMKAQMEKMPPERRARMQEILDRMENPEAALPKYAFKKKKTSRTIAGFKCDDYEIQEEGKTESDACFIPWKKAGVSAKELEEKLKGVAESLGGGRASVAAMEADFSSKFPGLPAYRKRFDKGGEAVSESTLVKLDPKGAIPANVFAVPQGYQLQQLPEGMQGGMPPPGPGRPGMGPPPGGPGTPGPAKAPAPKQPAK